MEKKKQRFRVLLVIEQDCKEGRSAKQMKRWVERRFEGCDYGTVKVVNCDLENPTPTTVAMASPEEDQYEHEERWDTGAD